MLHAIVNAVSIIQHVIQVKNGITKHVNVNVKIIVSAQIYYWYNHPWNPSTCICENNEYLKSIADTSVAECDETIIVVDIESTKNTNTIATNITSTPSINYQSKKVRDYYILHTVLLAAILLLITIIICYYYANQKGII